MNRLEEMFQYNAKITDEIFGDDSPMMLAETDPEKLDRLTKLVKEKMISKFGGES